MLYASLSLDLPVPDDCGCVGRLGLGLLLCSTTSLVTNRLEKSFSLVPTHTPRLPGTAVLFVGRIIGFGLTLLRLLGWIGLVTLLILRRLVALVFRLVLTLRRRLLLLVLLFVGLSLPLLPLLLVLLILLLILLALLALLAFLILLVLALLLLLIVRRLLVVRRLSIFTLLLFLLLLLLHLAQRIETSLSLLRIGAGIPVCRIRGHGATQLLDRALQLP